MNEGRLDEWLRGLAGPFFRHWRWIIVASWLLYAAWIIFNRWALIRGFALPDTDDNLRLAEVRAWLGGQGAVPIFNLMEDAATAEISRSQVWQWMRSPKGVLDDGRKVTRELFRELLAEELRKTPSIVGPEAYAAGNYGEGARLFEELSVSDDYVEFLTLPAYRRIA